MQDVLHVKMAVFMKKNGFYPGSGARHLLAVSGGLDSVCMVYLYKALGLDFGIVHCNFQLRGDASKGDAFFVEHLADQLNVPFFMEKFDTQSIADSSADSIQMIARDLRYAFFEKIRLRNGYTHIATAHHRDDSIETALFNFAKGTGLAGIRGIPIQNGFVIRPLLGIGREELAAFATSKQLHWREDSSNASDAYMRNFIRHHIFPKFKELNPNFSETATNSITRLRAVEANLNAFLAFFLEKNLKKHENGQESLAFSCLSNIPYPSEVLQHWLRPFGFDKEQCRQLGAQIEVGQSGVELEGSDGWFLLRDRSVFNLHKKNGQIYFEQRIEQDDLMVRLPKGRVLFRTNSRQEKAWPNGRFEILVDAAYLHFPLMVRPWKSGDSFQPFGMDGKHQKVQDFLVNAKVSMTDKADVWVLVDKNGTIVWIIGFRMAEFVRVGAETKQFSKLKVMK